MKQRVYYVLIFLVFVVILEKCEHGCTRHSESYETSSSQGEESSYPDNTYCADVSYYNPDTGFRNNYTLNVDVEDGKVVKIWFYKGWLDGDQFTAKELNDNGCCEVITYDGRKFNVKITGSKCSFTDEVIVYDHFDKSQLVNSGEEQVLKNCIECGASINKNGYNQEIKCDACKDKEICPLCGNMKVPVQKYCLKCVSDNNIVFKCKVCGEEGELLFNDNMTCLKCKLNGY
ncbi:hypothetical protein FEDK69T_08040 [Flavobacterium enshiense DK69]|nr:hypothetical protein [Flavobacterium enshiense]ESU24358.1 hypothetical protein FEDK69T_08040 [Flavobacterium enshiense DK69]